MNGVTHINLNSDRVIAARLCGRLDFYKLETYYKGVQIDWNFTSAYRRSKFFPKLFYGSFWLYMICLYK